MLAWSFAAQTVDEVLRLVRALGKHRYVREVDHRLHWTVDAALADSPLFAPHAAAFEARRQRDKELDPGSRDPSLWRPASVDETAAVLEILWSPGAEGDRARERLLEVLDAAGFAPCTHEPFESDADDPPHPELVQLNWVLLPVDELDADRHAGALTSMEDSGDEVDASALVLTEGPTLAAPELTEGSHNGVVQGDFLVWADGPYSYLDYVFRGASKSAKLVDPPEGYRDI